MALPSIRASTFMQTAFGLAVLWSFIEAFKFGNPHALRLWLESPEGVVALLGMAVAPKMISQTVERWGARKYATRGSVPPGEEP